MRIRDPHKRRDPHDRFTPAQVCAALEAAAGINLAAARILKCSHSTVASYVSRYDDIRKFKANLDEELLDLAEAKLHHRLVDSSNPAVQVRACIFYLSTRGSSRGYGRQGSGENKKSKTTTPPPTPDRSFDPSRLSVDELRTLEALHAKARGIEA
jgi:hypothetical protein